MILAVYLLIAGVLFPVVVGYIIYQNLKKGDKAKNEVCQRDVSEYEH